MTTALNPSKLVVSFNMVDKDPESRAGTVSMSFVAFAVLFESYGELRRLLRGSALAVSRCGAANARLVSLVHSLDYRRSATKGNMVNE
jgi:hypothetical protein